MVEPSALQRLAAEIARCRACPRLVAWREEVARVRRRSFRGERYWGRPVPGFGDPAATVALVGLAPGAHGANRTGRVFTGDASGELLYAALHRAGLARSDPAAKPPSFAGPPGGPSAPRSEARGDGLLLRGAFVTNACRCVPPGNRPATEELARCAPFLDRELAALGRVRAIVALGALAWSAVLAHLARAGHPVPSPRPRFGHGAELVLPGAPALVGSYHPSRRNTNTGRLTPAMLDAALDRAVSLAR
jgi:uracil-DNA glycosylase